MPYLLADQPAVPAGHADRPAYVRLGRTVTFAGLDDAATRFAADAVADGGHPDADADLFGAHLHTPLAAAELA